MLLSRPIAVVWLGFACSLAACQDATGPKVDPNAPIESPPAITAVPASLVTGDALAALAPDGRFTRAATPLPNPYPQLSRQQAESLAVAFLSVFRGSFLPGTEDERGGPINASRLQPCGPAIYAESSFEAAPDSASLSLRTHWGPRWVVIFCDHATQVMVVAVGAFATGLVGPASDPWRFADTELLTAAISLRGLPVGVRYPVNAEEAAQQVATRTGRRVDSIPRLIIAKPNYSPWWTLWSVSLEQPVTLRGVNTGRDRARRAVWYGLLPASRSLITMADPTSPIDEGPFITSDAIVRADGTRVVFPVILARSSVPAFGASEPVTVVAGP